MSRSNGLVAASQVAVEAEIVATLDVEAVVDDDGTALALGQTPEGDVLARRTAGRLHVPVPVSGGISVGSAVEDVDGSAGALHLGFLAVERSRLGKLGVGTVSAANRPTTTPPRRAARTGVPMTNH